MPSHSPLPRGVIPVFHMCVFVLHDLPGYAKPNVNTSVYVCRRFEAALSTQC